MNADRTTGACRGTAEWLRSAFRRLIRLAWPALAVVALLCLMAGTASYPFSIPDEARHAGIAHDMWAARQYLMPSVDGFPVLDGAPLYYWVTLGFLSFFGSHEWVLRLPSALAGAGLLVFLAKIFFPPLHWRLCGTLAALFLLQPAMQLAGRFASPDMLILLLLTLVLGSFLRAVQCLDQEQGSTSWLLLAWGAMALLGLASGPLSMLVPLLVVGLWLVLRRRSSLLLALCWWPGVLLVVLVLLPWLALVETRFPGILAAMLNKQMLALTGSWHHEGVALAGGSCWLLVLAACLPLLACMYRFRDSSRRAALRTPVAGLMALWLLTLLPLHGLMPMSPVGHAVALVVPLLYFGSLAMAPAAGAAFWAEAGVWLVVGLLAAALGLAGVQLLAQRLSVTSSLTQVLRQYYNPVTDKAIMLERFDYDFNFHMRSPKLVYVAADWAGTEGTPPPRWQQALSESARFVPQTAARLLLSTRAEPVSGIQQHAFAITPVGALASSGFLDRLCEPRMINLWVIGAVDAPQRYPILDELAPVVATGEVHAWYLGAGRELHHCVQWAQQR